MLNLNQVSRRADWIITLAIAIIVITAIVGIISWLFMAYFAVELLKIVQQDGLKQVLEAMWCGQKGC